LPGDSKIISQTQCWINTVIVGLNFCPFAKREVDLGRIHYQICRDKEVEQALQCLVEECQRLDENPAIETTLLIFAEGFQIFESYLDLLHLANELLLAEGYEGIYQLASFHPDYCFEGESIGDAANYTNRSPYPMLHLIREASLERALEIYPNPESIPERNIKVARDKGAEQMREIIGKCLRDKE
jgi:hypothetical protein